MAEKEIILQGEDGQVDELVLTTQDQASCNSLEDCVRMLFPQEGEKKPRLRFKGFEGDWERFSFGDLYEHCVVKNDLTYGTDRIISVANMYFIEDANMSDEDYLRTYNVFRLGDIAFEGNKSKNFAHGRFVENTIGDGIVSHVFEVFRPKSDNYDLLFWKYTINNEKLMGKILARCTKASTMMTNLVADDFLKESILVPSLEEQKKIGEFLSRLDTQIEFYQQQFDKLKQVKLACLETMFPQEEENVPAIRFEGFDKNWYKAKASELYETYNERNHPELPVLSACQDIRGMAVRSESGYDISHDRANEVTYKVVKPGQFVIHLRSFQGGFAHSAVEGITSPAYTVFGFKEPEKHDDYFWKTIFMSKDFINRLKTITYGIRDGRSISFSEFGDMELTFPEGEEQHRIASFFHSIDTQIAVQQQNLERLKQMKQSCLGLLFPDNQSITPPLRFKGFNGEWVEIMIGKITYSYSGGTPTAGNSDYYGGDIPFIRSGEIHQDTTELYLTQKGLDNSSAKMVKKGTILYALYGANSGDVDVAKIDGAINQAILAIIPQESMDSEFLSYLLQSRKDDIVGRYIQGGQGNLSAALLKGYSIKYPNELQEQLRIASFFSSLDKQIETQTQQVERLNQVKKACLNQFIA